MCSISMVEAASAFAAIQLLVGCVWENKEEYKNNCFIQVAVSGGLRVPPQKDGMAKLNSFIVAQNLIGNNLFHPMHKTK